MLRKRYLLFAGLIPALFAQPGLAAEDWNLCRIPSFNFLQAETSASDETIIEAQTVVGEDSESIHLTGDVNLTRAQQKIFADDIHFNKSTESISATGKVEFADPNYRLQSPSVQIDNQNDSAIFEQPVFELSGRHARGEAQKIEKLDQYRSRFSELTYTSCDPDDRDWHLRAAELEIDDESGRGSAKHTTIYFQEVPFLYLPYFQFPVDDRRMSGMLAPTIGYDETNGASLVVPVYWNIAPNYDMTITPASLGKLGLQLNTENRYLFESHQGELDLSYLDDENLEELRWFKQWHHRTSFAYDVNGDLLLAEVSDRDFFDDFESVAPRYNDIRHLERHLSFTRSGEIWNSKLLWQDYQTLDESSSITSRPYSRLPSITLDAQPEPWIGDLQTPMYLEITSFDRDESVTGNRTHVITSLLWNAADSWYFFEPELQLAFTDYQLDDNPGDNSIYRGLPTLSIDTGLIFERLTGSRNQWLQTLEPRLYFLHTPFEDQDDIPDFDTSLSSSTYNNLFKNNRFTGADRIGDANQVTFGLASRIFDNDSGAELLNARIGQAFYFKDRRVSLDGSLDEETKSDAIAELDVWPNSRTKIAARTVYDQDQSELSDKELSVNYSGNGLAANLGYYFSEGDLEQALVSMVYPVNERWTLIGKYQRSLLFDRPIEKLLGINYESCCWGLKILARESADEDEDFIEPEKSIYFEITFKGLSQLGRDIDQQLGGAIPGYRPGF
ncbi:MAG: LPS-assembly protein LptD [Gammaproteobacteria bacterium]|nr:LPS-assembly protein LptD [Gammaproteobacteria bacterium]